MSHGSVPKASAFLARQKARWLTLRSALRDGNEEDRYKAVRFVVLRLPLSDATKQKLIAWGLDYLVDRHRSSLRSKLLHAQRDWEAKGHLHLQQLLASGKNLELPAVRSPKVSFIIVFFNKAHLSILSIESLLQFADDSYELIVVDNASTDETAALLDRIHGAKIVHNSANAGFGAACMQGADIAVGEYLCFLNNDALLTQGALSAVLRNFDRDGVGAVGGKILLANGRLQEAGSIIWRDGSALGYGRGDDPDLPQYNFRRPVDYCSAVFLTTPKKLFHDLGGFSSEFAPAYYEDTDYCMTLWRRGFSIIYEPLAQIVHYESASSGGNELARGLMASQQVKFRDKWAAALENHYPADAANVCAARISVSSRSQRILYIDDRIPRRTLGAGFPRSNDIVTELARLGYHVVCSTSTFPLLGEGYADLPREVELFDGFRFRQKLIGDYMRCADVVWVSRPHNMKLLMTEHPAVLNTRKFALIYDAEALFSQRTQDRTRLLGEASRYREVLDPTGPEEEFSLAKKADCVTVVSEADRQAMLQAGVPSVSVVGHRMSVVPTTSSFAERDTFLFVGSVHGPDNPNADSVRHFCHDQWRTIHRATGAPLVVAGYGTELLRAEIKDPSVRILGAQDDLRPLYERARVFVVPTRYAAGLPFKAHEAAAAGVPLVVSAIIGRQIGWSHGDDYYVASGGDQFAAYCVSLYSNESLWQSFRDNALKRVRAELNPERFNTSLQSVLSSVISAKEIRS